MTDLGHERQAVDRLMMYMYCMRCLLSYFFVATSMPGSDLEQEEFRNARGRFARMGLTGGKLLRWHDSGPDINRWHNRSIQHGCVKVRI
jgi:hypothetical protein